MKPGPAISGGSIHPRASGDKLFTTSDAMSRGLRPSRFASPMATLHW